MHVGRIFYVLRYLGFPFLPISTVLHVSVIHPPLKIKADHMNFELCFYIFKKDFRGSLRSNPYESVRCLFFLLNAK